jgi:hypothetical protein
MSHLQINLTGWQDYRGKHSAGIIYVETSKESLIPVRDQLNEQGKGNLFEPNYETRTYGFISSAHAKQLNNIVKARHKYVLFATRYEGMEKDFKHQFLIHGYMRIDKTIDSRARHMRKYLMADEGTPEPSCINETKAESFYSEDMNFYSPEDSIILTNEKLEEWDAGTRVSRQMKFLAKDEALDSILEHFASKTAINDEYIETVREYISVLNDAEEDDEDED